MKTLWILVLLSLSCYEVKTGATPLYQDPDGWQLMVGHSGEEITYPYTRAKEIALENGFQIPNVGGMDYISKDPHNFYGFSIISNGYPISWSEDAQITLYYISGKDTLSATSGEVFFCREQVIQGKPLPGSPVYGPVTVPNSYYRIFSTGNGNPIVFARFPFGKEPDKLVRCTVKNVYSIKEVTQ